jgi:hypothetical protein
MTYEPGAYSKELVEDHRRGEHSEEKADQCPTCEELLLETVPEGFSSWDEYSKVSQAWAGELEGYLEAHLRGEHQEKSVDGCIECARIEGGKI